MEDPYIKSLEKKLHTIEGDSRISPRNKEILRKFNEECLSKGLTKKRIVKYLRYLHLMAAFLKIDFDRAGKEDLKKLVAHIEEMDWAEWTKYDNKFMLKRFYKWLEGDDEEMPKKIRWLKPRLKNNKLMSPEEILTDQEVKDMIEACTNIRDKALVSVLYESGCRVSEFRNMKIKDARQDDYGFVIHVTGKTGPRRVRLLDSVPCLSNWLATHSKTVVS